MNWNQLYNREIVKENPVLGINTVELLEKSSTYINNKENYFNRIKKSLEYIPNEFKDAALAIFSNVIYVPNEFMKATHHYFGKNFKEKYNLHTSEQIGESSHIFEVDPSGLKNAFFQINDIYQRLHPDYYARIDDIADISKTLLDLFHTDKDVIISAYNEVVKLGRKAHWIILTDKVMSGQSLSKDIERYIIFRDIASHVTNNLPLIEIKAQIITQDAINAFHTQHTTTSGIDLDYAILFGEEMKINSDTCRLFSSSKIHSNAIKLCSWLAEQVIQPDQRFNTMREKSGDNLQFGYRKCGLTLVDSSNCPTNSIPLLWYSNTDTKLSHKYKGPFPRVQSRLGIQLEQPIGNSWEKITERKTKIVQILKSLNDASES